MQIDRDLIQPGTQFDCWSIQEQIGRGAYGKVYRAQHTVIGRQVALKHVARPFDTAPDVFRKRVRREAQIAGRLRHANVVTLYGAKELDDESWLFEFEYVAGTDLAQLIRAQGALGRDQTLRIIAELADAIQALHALGAVHNDIKPANVLISSEGPAKLADFGLGSLPSEESLISSTELRPRGTPLYMPPEVILGQAGDTRSDLWSLGAVLHEMATGAPPFHGPHLPALFSAIHNAAPSEAPREADTAAVAVARWCLAKRPADRPSNAGQVLQALRAEIELPQLSTGPSTPMAFSTKLVGRDEELAALRMHRVAAFRAEAGYCFISGEAGVGKSTLIDALAQEWRSSGGAVVSATVTSTRSLLRSVNDATRDSLWAREEPGQADIPSEATSTAATQPQALLRGCQALLSKLTHTAPLLLIIEDTQHCDDSDQRHLTYLLDRFSRTRTLVVATQRSNAQADVGEKEGPRPLSSLLDRPDAHGLQLHPLTDRQVLAIAETEAGARGLEMELASRIAEMADGLPLFAVEAVRHLISSGQAEIQENVLRRSEAWDPKSIPGRLRDVIDARLAALDLESRTLLETACVDGCHFDGRAVAEVSGRPLLQVLRALQALAQDGGLVRPAESGFAFSHGLLQERMYAQLAPELRTVLHGLLAAHLEQRQDERDPADPERVGLHWRASGDLDRARPYLILASRAAGQRQEMLRAVRLADDAGMLEDSVAASLVQQHAGEFLRLTAILREVGRWPDAERILCRTEAVAAELSDATLAARPMVWRNWFALLKGGASTLDEPALRAALEPTTGLIERGIAAYLLGCGAKHREEFDESRLRLEEALTCFLEPANSFWRPHALHEFGSVQLTLGRIPPAVAAYREAAGAAAQAGSQANETICNVVADIAGFQAGSLEGLATSLGDAVRVLTLAGARDQAEYVRVHRAQVLLAEGRVVEAEELVDQAQTALASGELVYGLIAAEAEAAFLRLNRGDVAGAMRAATEAETRSREAGFISGEIEGLLLRAECLARIGSHVQSRPVFDEALRRAAAGADEVLKAMTGQRCAIARAALGEAAVPEEALQMLADKMDRQGTLAEETRSLIQATLSLRVTGPATRGRVAETLTRMCSGPRRSHRRLLADLLRARMEAMPSGCLERLQPMTESGVTRSVQLRDIWAQLEFLELTDHIDPSWSTVTERRALLASITLPDTHSAQAAWLATRWAQPATKQ